MSGRVGVRLHRNTVPTSHATVTVVVPCYNYGRYLPDAVGSVLSQEGVGVSVVIVDDASQDDSPDIARSLAGTAPNVEAVLHQQNLGHIATYNDGLDRADSEYVLLLSADDLLAPGALARAVAIMQRHPRVGLVYGFAPGFQHRPPQPRRARSHYLVWPGDQWLTRVCRRGQNPVCTPSAVLRRDVFASSGGYDARLPHAADLLMWLHAAAVSDVAYVTGADQAFYRVHDTNMHSTTFSELTADLQQRRETFRIFFGESASVGPGDPRLRLAEQALAREALHARTGGPARRWSGTVSAPLGWHFWRQFGVRL